MGHVTTCISMSKEQQLFLRENGYSASRIFQLHVSELMKLSKGQDSHQQPLDEPQRGSIV